MSDLRKLQEILDYNKDTGDFFWKVRRGGTKSNTKAGYLHPNGYIYIQVNRKNYRAHRLAWLFVYGEYPKNLIDHINRVKHDNRIKNLRDVPKNVNHQNTGAPSSNKTGVKGVSWVSCRNKFLASIKHHNKSIHLGYFDSLEEAKNARKLAEDKLWNA